MGVKVTSSERPSLLTHVLVPLTSALEAGEHCPAMEGASCPNLRPNRRESEGQELLISHGCFPLSNTPLLKWPPVGQRAIEQKYVWSEGIQEPRGQVGELCI